MRYRRLAAPRCPLIIQQVTGKTTSRTKRRFAGGAPEGLCGSGLAQASARDALSNTLNRTTPGPKRTQESPEVSTLDTARVFELVAAFSVSIPHHPLRPP